MKLPNIIFGIIIICIGALFFGMTFDFPKLTLEPVGPSFMPRVYSVLLIMLGLLLIMNLFKNNEAANSIDRKNLKNVLFSMLLVLMYIILIRYIGFYISTLLFSISFLLFSRVRNKYVIISLPIGIITVIFIFFDKLLKVAIPLGILFS